MSGLDAIREAIKRSPETIGILLAGTDSDDGLEALVLGVGSERPEALDRRVDKPWIDLLEVLVTQAQAVHRSGSPIFRNDVGVLD